MGGVARGNHGLPSLDGLEEWERRKIMSVLQRDVDVQKQKDLQIKRLRAEIGKLSEMSVNVPEKCCARCRATLGLLINSGSPCPKCKIRVCSTCRVQNDGYRLGWICVLCDKTQQYAVLTGEWIRVDESQPKRGRNLSKSTSAVALQVRRANTENDYYPAASVGVAVKESSVSEALLRQMKEECIQSWKPLDTAGLPPKAMPHSTNKSSMEKSEREKSASRVRSRSPSCQRDAAAVRRESSWRQQMARATAELTTVPTQEGVSSKGVVFSSLSNPAPSVPVVLIEHIEEEQPRRAVSRSTSRESTGQQSTLNAFNRGFRCPSVPNQLNRLAEKSDNQLSCLLSVHNVRVSVRSTSSDNLSSSPVSAGRSRADGKSVLDEDGIYNQRRTRHGSYCEGRPATVPKEEASRPPSPTSSDGEDELVDAWDDNASLSSGSVVSLSSCSVTSSVTRQSLKREKRGSRSSWSSSYSSKATIQGEVLLACNYNCGDASLEVQVTRCRDLCPMSRRKKRANPYIKLYLLPDVSPLGKRKTRVKRGTVNPEFNEVLKYSGLTKSELETRTLLLTVWHYDVIGRSHFMGEVRLKMSDYPWIPGEQYWVSLGPHTVDTEIPKELTIPEMTVSLKFTRLDSKKKTGCGTLHCVVQCPRNLPSSRIADGASCYIKCYLYPDHRKTTKQKSPLFKLGFVPTWKHSFVYQDITLEELEERCLELTVWGHQRVGANEFLGGIRLNLGTGFSHDDKVDWMDSSEEEVAVWKQVLSQLDAWVDATIPMRMDMESKL